MADHDTELLVERVKLLEKQMKDVTWSVDNLVKMVFPTECPDCRDELRH